MRPTGLWSAISTLCGAKGERKDRPEMKRWSTESKVLLTMNAAVALCIITTWCGYALFGHQLIEAMYRSPWNQFLHKIMMMEGQHILPLERYLRGADELMLSGTLTGLVLCAALTLIVKSPPRITIAVLAPIFIMLSLLASGIAFIYPLEIETRESTVWLHVLALKHGVNIYDHNQVAFINQNHGPFDPLFKLSIATLFPFLESWQVARFSVLALPYAFLFVAWRLLRKSSPGFVLDVVYLAGIGYLFLVISAKDFIFVGRSDATAALLLLPLTYFSVSRRPLASWSSLRYGLLWGSLGILVILTNWRMIPVVGALLVFRIWLSCSKNGMTSRMVAEYLAGCACASAAIFVLLLFYSFDFDLSLYFKHFFGTYSKSSGHGHHTYAHASGIWFLGSLLRPTASPDSLKGGPVLWALAVYLLVPNKMSAENRAWFLLAAVVFIACTVAYYLNYYGGGQWYYMPFLIVLWFFLCANYTAMSTSRLAAVGTVMTVLLCVNFRTVIEPSLWRASTFSQAYNFMRELRSLQTKHRLLSEDTFFFRTSYQGELIDMGDMVSRVRKRGYYYGDEFNRTVDRHFERIRQDPPDYIVTGFTESPELRQFAEKNYLVVGRGPANFTANGLGESRLFRRKDLGGAQQTAHGSGIAARSPAP
jgi:hypothetical protein